MNADWLNRLIKDPGVVRAEKQLERAQADAIRPIRGKSRRYAKALKDYRAYKAHVRWCRAWTRAKRRVQRYEP